MTHIEQLNMAMNALISGNQAFRAGIARNADSLPPDEYVRLFGTVRIDTGRMSGKSTWIANHANDDNALVIASKGMINQPVFDKVRYKLTLNDVWEGVRPKCMYSRIYVDCASYLLPTRADEQRLIEALVTRDQQMVVLIG